MADQSGGSATSFRTAGVAYRLATAQQPPTTEAAGPAPAAHPWVSQAPVRHRRAVAAQPDSRQQRLVFQLASADGQATAGLAQKHSERRRVRPGVIARRPLAALALVPEALMLFLVGGLAGAIGKTVTAPLDRVKILLQVVDLAAISTLCLVQEFQHIHALSCVSHCDVARQITQHSYWQATHRVLATGLHGIFALR